MNVKSEASRMVEKISQENDKLKNRRRGCAREQTVNIQNTFFSKLTLLWERGFDRKYYDLWR